MERTKRMDQRAAAVAWNAMEHGAWDVLKAAEFCRWVREHGMSDQEMQRWKGIVWR